MDCKKIAAILCGGICVVLIAYYGFVEAHKSATALVRIDEAALYAVSHVVDGDTVRVKVDSREIIVRLLGINTPETVDPRKPVQCFGTEASNETKLLLDGHQIRLSANPNREKTDRYGRYLLYAYRDDGLFLNEYLVREGFAREYTVGNAYSFQKDFRQAENEAKEEKRGLWSACKAK
ncbi:MAG: Micrococcal nuclease [Candidatus Parcubacteria bacterium]|nr:Micrococcal nuclease [Candidatus Parcubacteria bacterium]